MNPRIPTEQGPQPCAFSKLGNLRFLIPSLPNIKSFPWLKTSPSWCAIFYPSCHPILSPPETVNSNLFKPHSHNNKGDYMNSTRHKAASFLDGLVVGFLIASILLYSFLYIDFIPPYSILLALFAGGFVAGLITRGTWKGGVSAFFSGFTAIFLFQITKDVLTLQYEFSQYHLMVQLMVALLGGVTGGILTTPTQVLRTKPKGEPQKVYICPQCGAEIFMKTKFCPQCGSRLGKPLSQKIKDITKSGGEPHE